MGKGGGAASRTRAARTTKAVQLAKPRGRPRRSADREQAVRERVIAEARRLFAEEGFAAVSMRRIAAASDCSPMNLYGYFHSKNEILRYIWDDFFVELFGRIASAAARGTPAQRLRKVCAAYVDYWCEYPERYRMVYLNQDQAAAGERLYVDASSIVERFGLFRELVEAVQRSGAGRPGDPQLMGEALVCSLLGLCHSLVTIPEYPWPPRKRLLETLLALVIAEPA